MMPRSKREVVMNKVIVLSLLTCSLTFAVSRGNVNRSATQAAEPAVNSSTPIPGRLLRVEVTFLTEMDFEAAVVTAVVDDVAVVAAVILLLFFNLSSDN